MVTKGGLSDISICLEELKQSFMPKLAEEKKLFMFASLKHFIRAQLPAHAAALCWIWDCANVSTNTNRKYFKYIINVNLTEVFYLHMVQHLSATFFNNKPKLEPQFSVPVPQISVPASQTWGAKVKSKFHLFTSGWGEHQLSIRTNSQGHFQYEGELVSF